jgi:hypothetical protein
LFASGILSLTEKRADSVTKNLASVIIAEWQDDSYAKRREIILDGLIAASMRQIFASESSCHSAIILQLFICCSVTYSGREGGRLLNQAP